MRFYPPHVVAPRLERTPRHGHVLQCTRDLDVRAGRSPTHVEPGGQPRCGRKVAFSLEEPAAVDLGQAPETFQLKELGHALQLREVFLDECVGKILQILGKPDSLIKPVADRQGHDRRYSLDTTKLEKLGFRCDTDFDDALHPQTILAYEINDRPLPVEYGAPLRLRVERQLGYKMAKYVMRVELVETFAAFGRGKGGYWEDRGYEWYAGI